MAFEMQNETLVKYTPEPGVTEVTVPDGVKVIGRFAFADRSELTGGTLPDSLERIERDAFFRCTGLRSVRLPDAMRYIGDGAFQDCAGLTGAVIPDSVRYIGASAFRNCSRLVTAIPEKTEHLCLYAFVGCRDVTYRGLSLKSCLDEAAAVYFTVTMLRSRDYSARIPDSIKFPVLWQLFMKEPDDEALYDYIWEQFPQMFEIAIRTGDESTVEWVCQRGDFLTAKNIDRMIGLAIATGQTGSQLMLLNYKKEHIGYSDTPFNL